MTVGGHLIVGPAEHGVVIHAQRLAAQLGGPVARELCASTIDPARVDAGLPAGAPILVHWTDALFGAETTSAAERFTGLAAALNRPVITIMHDLPDPADEPKRWARRSASYTAVAAASAGVVVASHHEAARLSGAGCRVPVQIVPLPIESAPAARRRGGPPEPEVMVLGFIYPGKGHEDVLAAMADLPAGVRLTAAGRPADGHHDLVTGLQRAAARAGRDLEVTGFLSDDELLRRMRHAAVAVAPARKVSASGSLGTWIGAGRRPLAAAGPFTRELAQRCPGCVWLYDGADPAHLAAALRLALAENAATWLPAGAQPGPTHRAAAMAITAFSRSIMSMAGAAG